MAKDWKVTQTATVKGVKRTCSFILPYMETADVSAFCTLLEGGYQITEINESLSDMTSAETNAANSTPVNSIYIRGENAQSVSVRGFGGSPIHFKNTVTEDDIGIVLQNKKYFNMFQMLK